MKKLSSFLFFYQLLHGQHWGKLRPNRLASMIWDWAAEPWKSMFYNSLKVPFIVWLMLSCVDASQPKPTLYDTRNSAQEREMKRHMTNMERPVYPVSALIHRRTGSGLFWMRFDKTGRVTAVKIVESTEQPELDNAAVCAFYHWRCRPGEVDQVVVPVTFTLHGPHSSVGGHAY